MALLPFLGVSPGRYDAKRIHGKVEAFFELNGIPVADLLPVIKEQSPKELSVNGHDHHPNESAHSLFAEGIWASFYATGPSLDEQAVPPG